jgi:hypothetical protein
VYDSLRNFERFSMYDVYEGATIGQLVVGNAVRWKGGTGRMYFGFVCRCSCGTHVRVRKEDLAHGKQLFCTKTCTARSPRTLDEWLQRTTKSGDCMLWQGPRTNGYGRITVDKHVVYAHREVHRLASGESPEVVMHTCDTPQCINPAHLKSGDIYSNTQDMVDKGRQSKGAAHYKAKLTEKEVREIRAARTAGVPVSKLAKAYEVSRGAIYYLVSNRSWKDIV